MKVDVLPGKYIVAVSGGVDSVVLLDLLTKVQGLHLMVAHVDHDIRDDSSQDAEMVANLAHKYSLEYESTRLSLDENSSESLAREQRYAFLRECQLRHGAAKILTAHHQDDLVETAILNLMRGTGWRGLAPFTLDDTIQRPLLDFTKDQIIGYARRHNLQWHEDSTNAKEKFLRNYIRLHLTPILNQKSTNWYEQLLAQITQQRKLRTEIEQNLQNILQQITTDDVIKRHNIIMLPQNLAYEVLQTALKSRTGNTVERHLAESALIFAKTAFPGKVFQISKNWQIRSVKGGLTIDRRASESEQ